MSRSDIYLQNIHTIIFNGVPLSGFDEGDFIEVEIEGNAAQRTKGGDGPAMNVSTYQGGKITINLLPTSPALGIMYQIWKAQRLKGRMYSIAVYTGVKELITASGCAMGQLPKFSTGGEKMTNRSFPSECLAIALETAGLETVASGFVGGTI